VSESDISPFLPFPYFNDRLTDFMIVRQFLLSVDKATYDGVIRNDKGKKVEISTDDEVSVWEQELSHLDDSMQFLREQEALAKHPHPFIFKVRHIFVVNNEVIGIVTNVAPPMTLAIITERPSTAWTPSVKSKFVFALAVGTAHLHSLGFVHGNLEPRNIFLKDKPEPVISPLGIELHWNPDIDICSPPPHFRAPEVLIDERYYFISDVYSFGMTLYSMFAPRGANTVEIYVGWGLSSRRVERHPTIPAFYWELIEKCWQSNPDERPTFLTILNDLRHCHSYVFDEANMADVLVYEATLESTMSLFVATASIRQWRPLAMLIPSRQILKKEAISNSQLFIRFANRAEPFLLLPEDTPLSVGATSRDVLLVLGRDQWPVVVTPARLVRWLLDDNDFEKIEQIGDPGAVGPVCCCRNKRTGLEFPSKAILSDRTDPEKSFREAVVHSCVVHPTITTFAGLLLSKKDLHATMYTEYYPSGSITSYLRSHPDVSNTT
jgi:serine/threonine protein kinase